MLKTALLSGAAGLLLMAAPAFAQDAATQTPPPAGEQPAERQTLQIAPGAKVRGGDGTELGAIENVRANADGGQELLVRGVDGVLRAVPVAGIRQDGDGVVVDFTSAQYASAAAIEAPAAPPAPDAPPPPSAPAAPAAPAAPDAATPAAEPVSPPEQSPPTLPPSNPATPEPNEGQEPSPTPEQPGG